MAPSATNDSAATIGFVIRTVYCSTARGGRGGRRETRQRREREERRDQIIRETPGQSRGCRPMAAIGRQRMEQRPTLHEVPRTARPARPWFASSHLIPSAPLRSPLKPPVNQAPTESEGSTYNAECSCVARPPILVGFLLISAALISCSRSPASSAGSIPRTAAGKPDLSGIWQVRNRAAADLEDHVARHQAPAGKGVVQGGPIPYQPWAAAKKIENARNRATADPLATCYMPGVPASYTWSSRSRSSKHPITSP